VLLRTLTAAATACIAATLCAPVLCAQWQVSVERGTASRSATVLAVAREASDSGSADDPAVSLVVRCSGRSLDAFITTRDALDADTNGDVRVRVEADSIRPKDMRWQATKSNSGAFIPTPELRDVIQRGILRTRTLRIATQTLTRGRVTYEFPVREFRQALDALRDACPNERGGALAAPSR
jgi:hypothetical protein